MRLGESGVPKSQGLCAPQGTEAVSRYSLELMSLEPLAQEATRNK